MAIRPQSSSGRNPPHCTPPPSKPSDHCFTYISSSSCSSMTMSDLGYAIEAIVWKYSKFKTDPYRLFSLCKQA